jgi:hypothetical protein
VKIFRRFAFTVAILCSFPALSARAFADSGPNSQVQYLRKILPPLLISHVLATETHIPSDVPSDVDVIDVTVSGNDAIVHWKRNHLATYDFIAGLHRSAGRWWYAATDFGMFSSPDVFDATLAQARQNPETFMQRWPLSRSWGWSCSGPIAMYQTTWPGLFHTHCGYSNDAYEWVGGFHINLNVRPDSWLPGMHFGTITGSGTDAGFYFDTALNWASSLHATGATAVVWFPYLLSANYQYTLTSPLLSAPVIGTLQDNCLHFEIPQFEVPTHGVLRAEIRGAPLTTAARPISSLSPATIVSQEVVYDRVALLA